MKNGIGKGSDKMGAATGWSGSEGPAGSGSGCLIVPKGMSVWAPKEEKAYTITIVPHTVTKNILKFPKSVPKPGQYYFVRSYKCHASIGPEGGKTSYVCTAGTFGKPCAVCEYITELNSDPEAAAENEELIKSIRMKDRQVYNVLVHGEEKKGVQLWDISWHLFGVYLKGKIDKAEDAKRARYAAFYNPEKGYDLRLEPIGKKMGKFPFLEFTSIEFKQRKEPIPEEILEQAAELETVIRVPDYEDVKVALNGGSEEEEGDEEPKKNRPSEDDDDSELEDDDADAADEEDEDEGEDGEEDEGDEGDDDGDAEDEDDDDDAGDDDEEDDDEADDDEEDDDEADDEPEFGKGDAVSFVRKGKRMKGTVVKTNDDGDVIVKVVGHDKPFRVNPEDVKPATGKAPPSLDDDDDDDDRPPLKRGVPKKTKKKPGRN